MDGYRTVHMCQSVRGPLTNWKKADWKRNARGWKQDGRSMTGEDLKEYFLDQLALGREVIPLGEPCEGFDYKTGCPGHDVEEDRTND